VHRSGKVDSGATKRGGKIHFSPSRTICQAFALTPAMREAAAVHDRWLRVTHTRVLPRLHVGLLGLAALRQVSGPAELLAGHRG
jgi:hypothetical protein